MKAAEPLTVGIDIGTTSVKALAVDSDGVPVARSRRPHTLSSPVSALLQHDAADAWREGVVEAWGSLLASLGGAHSIAGACVSALAPTLTAVDAAGMPLCEGLLYGDARGNSGEGPPIENGEQAGFLRWLAQRHPAAHGYWPASTVANFALSGVAALDEITALTFTPLIGAGRWDTDRLGEMGVEAEKMPTIASGWSPAGEADGVPLGGGIIDGLAELAVAGAVEPGDVFVGLGGTLVCWIVAERHLDAPGLWAMPHIFGGRWLIGGPSSAGGMFLDKLNDLLGAPLEAEFEAMPGAARGDLPVWVPSVRPERVAAAGNNRSASVHGLDRAHRRAHLFRAAYEASGFTVRRFVERSGVAAKRLVAVGGGTTSAAWLQALADCTALPVEAAATPETAALGAAFAARLTAGLESDLADGLRWARTGQLVEPDQACIETAHGRYERFVGLLNADSPPAGPVV